MKTILLCAVSICVVTGCATNEELAAREDRAGPAEYTTGSSLAQKSKARKPDVQTLTDEELEEIQRNRADPVR